MKSASSNQEFKKAVGVKAADLINDNMIVGIGTGSTVAFFIEEIGKRVKEGLKITGVPTSYQTKIHCYHLGIPILESGMIDRIDITVDGADEIDNDLNAIKGGGAAHTQEKILASMADQFVLIADESKMVENLGEKFPVPIEVIPGALAFVEKAIKNLGGNPEIRTAVKKDGPVVTDNGNFVVDVYFDEAPNIHRLESRLRIIPGIVENGLFLGMAKKALIAGETNIITLEPKK